MGYGGPLKRIGRQVSNFGILDFDFSFDSTLDRPMLEELNPCAIAKSREKNERVNALLDQEILSKRRGFGMRFDEHEV